MFGVYQSAAPAHDYVDAFIRHHCPAHAHARNSDAGRQRDRNAFLEERKANPVPVVDYRGGAVRNEERKEIDGYQFYDAKRKRVRTIWADYLDQNEMMTCYQVIS